ncbi:MAG: shikimate kinase [Paraclostridium sp.]
MNRIILIGFMGCGKTTVGKQLEKKFNLSFIDTDEEIEKKYNTTISDIFRIYGEDDFRTKEVSVLADLLTKDNIIISTGGGIIESVEAIDMLVKEKSVIWLDANVFTIVNRLRLELDNRPKLKNEKNLELSVKKLLDSRYEKYKKSSSIRIDVNNKNIDEVLSDILVYIDNNMLL